MARIFGYSREAIRVKVKKCEGLLQPEYRKFSVDPQITSFEVLQSILRKAFDIKGEFTICCRAIDEIGHEIYTSILSDWELEAAFVRSHNISLQHGSEPSLCLRVDTKPFAETTEEWDVTSNNTILNKSRIIIPEIKASQRLPGIIMNQVERTFNMVQRALNLGEDGNIPIHPPRPPLSDAEFRTFHDPVGQIIHAKELRSVIYYGGIDPSLRKVVWKYILNVYPDGMSGRERMDYMKRKSMEYLELRDTWKDLLQKGNVGPDLAYTTGMVRKDVLRTDRHHRFYAGNDDNQNIASLFNILTTYALNHPKVSYCQGMSDLASPLLVTMGDEAQAYICFCALMQRLGHNFMLDGIAMTQKFTHLAEALLYYDPDFFAYLKLHQADDLLFCYRWLLLEMKREFAFEDSLRMLEVLWSSLPASPPIKELKLYDVPFKSTIETPPVSPLVKTPRENAYTKVCALRRQSSSISIASWAGGTTKNPPSIKRQIQSLDETVSRAFMHAKIFNDDAIQPAEECTETVRQGHFKNLKDRISNRKGMIFASVDKLDKNIIKEEQEVGGKVVKNFNEFLNFAKKNDDVSVSDDTFESSPDDSQEYFPMTTSITRELRLDLENLDRQVFGSNYQPNVLSLDDSESTTSGDSSLRLLGDKNNASSCDCLLTKTISDYVIQNGSSSAGVAECASVGGKPLCLTLENNKVPTKNGKDDIFVWENPLHQQSPELRRIEGKYPSTPDEQVDELEYEEEFHCKGIFSESGEIFEESQNGMIKSVTPIRLVRKEQSKPPRIEIPPEPKSSPLEEEKELSAQQIQENYLTMIPSMINPSTTSTECEEAIENINIKRANSLLPPPHEFGGGNPFLMFLCITLLLQHRNYVIENQMDYNEMAMHFDKMVRKHNVIRVLDQARSMFANYMKLHTSGQLSSASIQQSNNNPFLNDLSL